MSFRRLMYHFITVLYILVNASSLYAIVALPRTHELVQPDGSIINARQWGDEWLHGWETVEGYTIVKNATGLWVYAERDALGRLIPTEISADDTAPEGLQGFLRPGGERARKALGKMRKASVRVVPTTGTVNVPIILINYNDTTTTNSSTDFESLVFGSSPAIATGPGSMKDYYEEVSYGSFTVSSGPSGVSGWHTAANPHLYYGQNDASGYDLRPADLVIEAVNAADLAGFDFSQYDSDSDGKVDVVGIVHQGRGEEESGVANDIWSHRWSLTSAGVGAITKDGKTVDDYIIMPERYGASSISSIGVFTHEFGHAFGLPDLYDTDNSSEGIGKWGLMAGGSWTYTTNPGDSPAHMSAWSKYFLGWVTPTQVTGTLTSEAVDQAATTADAYKLLTGTPTSGEYFLVENRQTAGFDQGLPGDGLLIWHIDGGTINSNLNSNTVNDSECYPGGPSCASNHYGVALVQADNLWDLEKNADRGDTGDPYPGSTSNTSLTDSTSPNSNLYNGSASGVSVTAISASGPSMTATLSVSGTITTSAITSSTTTSVPTSVNLTPYTPSGWDYPIVPSSNIGTYNVGTLCAGETTYVDLAVINEGPGDITETFYLDLYIDGVLEAYWYSSGLEANYYSYVEDYGIVVSEGPHTLKIKADSDNDVTESDETDNEYERTFTWERCRRGWPAPRYESILGEESQEKLVHLRRFRDEKLLSNDTGKEYVDLLYNHSGEVDSLLEENPDLSAYTAEVMYKLEPEVTALLNGEEITISKELVEDIVALLAEFEAEASPGLKVTIKRAKRMIKRGTIFKLLGITVEE